MKIVDLIKSLEEDLEVLKKEPYQRHQPEYQDEHDYYNILCKSFDKIDKSELDLLSKNIQNKSKIYNDVNMDYASHLQGLVGFSYQVAKMNLHDIVEKVIIPELILANKWISSLGRK